MNKDPHAQGSAADPATGSAVRLWDLPVRIVHWSFVLLLPLQWWTHKADLMSVHLKLGYVALALLIFRIYWGFFGGSAARFRNFVKGPQAILAYARTLASRERKPTLGHNPIGGLSTLVLLGLLLLQVGLGLFADDVDGEVSGSLARYVSYGVAGDARELHETMFNVLLAFVALHVAAIVFHGVYGRDNLVRPMLSGYKQVAEPDVRPSFAPAWRFWLGVILAAAIAYCVSQGLRLP